MGAVAGVTVNHDWRRPRPPVAPTLAVVVVVFIGGSPSGPGGGFGGKTDGGHPSECLLCCGGIRCHRGGMMLWLTELVANVSVWVC
jgi:hypothetical protein